MHLERFKYYVSAIKLLPNTQGKLYNAMVRFSKQYQSTSKSAFMMHLRALDSMGFSKSTRDTFCSAYQHYVHMCKSEYQPGDEVPYQAPPKPKPKPPAKPDFWAEFGLKPGHPARVLCKSLFDNPVSLRQINLRQVDKGTWAFDGDEMCYHVKVDSKRCTLTAHSKHNGRCYMNREYSIMPNRSFELIQ